MRMQGRDHAALAQARDTSAATFVSVIFSDPFLRNGIGGLVFLPSRRQRSVVAGRFLDELHAGAEPEFGVDVGEVGLHGAR